MPASPVYGLRWPLSTDTPDVPRDLENLAEDTEAGLRLHGSRCEATASLTGAVQGVTNVLLTSISGDPEWTLSSGRVIAPRAGSVLVIISAYFSTSLSRAEVGFASPEGPFNGLQLSTGTFTNYSGAASRVLSVTAGQQLPQPRVTGIGQTYNVTVSLQAAWIGDPA